MAVLRDAISALDPTDCRHHQLCRKRIAEILRLRHDDVIARFYETYCVLIKDTDPKNRNIEHLKELCSAAKGRFSMILDRFTASWMTGSTAYVFPDGPEEVEYSLRFLVPAKNRDVNSHVVVKIVNAFFDIVTTTVLRDLDPAEFGMTEAEALNLMSELIYINFEHLWVSSVVGFRYQHKIIQGLLSKLMKAQEEERQRFWQEIHDDFLQILAVIPLKLQIIKGLADTDPSATKDELQHLIELTEETGRHLREISHGFNLFWTERRGLAFSLRTFARRFEKEFRLPVKLDICKKGESIRGFPGVTLFRVVQEALYNAGKHAKATQARVRISTHAGELIAVIEDNGIGFDVRKMLRRGATVKNLGLMFMKERIKLLDASLNIDSVKGSGTRVTIHAPWNSFVHEHDWADRGREGTPAVKPVPQNALTGG